MFPTDIVIIAGARTPMARYIGAFSDVSAIDLAAHASKEAIRRSGVDPGDFDHVIFGNVMQTSGDAIYGARHVGLKAGLKIETPAVTVNRLCGSGIEDDHRRPDTTMETLEKLPPSFKKDGIVTAGNASGIVDGAAAVVVTREKTAKERGLKPVGRIVSWAVAGVDPSVMGIGPVPSSQKALKLAGLTLDQMDRVEVNEAVAAQYLAVEKAQ